MLRKISQRSRISGYYSNMVFLIDKFNFRDCPTVTAAFEIDGKLVTVVLEKILTRSIYPNGRCCRTIQPRLARKYPIYELTFNQTGFRMLLYDNRHFSILRQSFMAFEGEHLENKKLLDFEGKNNNYWNWRLDEKIECLSPFFLIRFYSLYIIP